MAAEAPSPPAKGGELGKRRLGTPAAVAQALAIGPMFSTAIVLSFVSNPVNGASFNTPLAVLVAGLGVLAIAYSIALFARQYQGAGAVYEYLTRGAHPAVGILAAGIFFTGTLFLGGGGIYIGLGILTQGFWVQHISTSTVPAWWLFLLLFLALVLVLNYLGVRIAIGAMLTFAALSFTPMLFLALAIIVKGGADGNTLAVFNPGTTSVHVVYNGVLLGILLFVGFEAAASIGEESHDPRRSIPRALLGTVGASALFFVIMAYAISIGLGKKTVEAGGWAFDPAALDKVATTYVGSWFATIIDLVVILDATALALAICVTIGRGYFALGRDGLLPSVFAKTSRHDTPWVGNLVVAVGGLGLMFLGLYSHTLDRFVGPQGLPSREFAAFLVAATAGSFAVELVYLFLAVAAIMLLVRLQGAWWQYVIVVVAIATPILGFYGALNPAPHDTTNLNWLALYWALGTVVLAAVWFGIVRVLRPQNVANAASYAAHHHGVAPLDESLDYKPLPE
ncbi:MAG TPA: APC family permease [Gaiellales bacterium]|jgi:amino acid transporter